VTAQAKQSAAYGTQVARERTAVVREKLPPTVREQPTVPLAVAGGATVLAALLAWLLLRRRRS
jgi:LPXTG-motif cell wall-anchored protein